jgi:hypothetical protein
LSWSLHFSHLIHGRCVSGEESAAVLLEAGTAIKATAKKLPYVSGY